MASQLAPTPEFVVERPVVQQAITGRVTQAMRYWLLALADRLNRTPEVVQTVSLTTQAASLGATTISVLSLPAGVYRLSAAARITTAASSSSSLTLTFGWTQAVTCTASSAAITGNTTATTGSFMVVVRADAATALTYATTYASSGGTAMVYRIDVAVEQLI
jgi:hypothetical protein|tara:strand:+ start:961 stop:1446 length:486 start_codon:yes stop_codon:yes gene_type:complete